MGNLIAKYKCVLCKVAIYNRHTHRSGATESSCSRVPYIELWQLQNNQNRVDINNFWYKYSSWRVSTWIINAEYRIRLGHDKYWRALELRCEISSPIFAYSLQKRYSRIITTFCQMNILKIKNISVWYYSWVESQSCVLILLETTSKNTWTFGSLGFFTY